MPFLRIERGQEIVELARLGVEIDLGGQPFDQLVELVGVLLHEPAGIGNESFASPDAGSAGKMSATSARTSS